MSAPTPLDVGQLGYDKKTNRVGKIMAYQSGRALLRPVRGGCEWEVEPADLTTDPDANAQLRARVRELNKSPL